MMPRYYNESWKRCGKWEKRRLVWFSHGCTFWTTDFSLVELGDELRCPGCGSVGSVVPMVQWESDIQRWADEQNELLYFQFILESHEECDDGSRGLGIAYNEWKAARE